MSNKRQLIPAAGLLGTIAIAVYMVIQLNAQTSTPAHDYRNATMAEVRDAQGQVVLRGQFVQSDEQDDDIERKATLEPTGVDGDAAGEAEVEFSTGTPAEQELEFSIRNVQPGAVFVFAIDGHEVTTATADRRGRVELELEPGIPGTRGGQ